jgi:hypothetical protein
MKACTQMGAGSYSKIRRKLMITFVEEGRQSLEEMAIVVISAREENLPFRVVVMHPDHKGKPHAYIMDLQTGTKRLGKFWIPASMPQDVEDVKDCFMGEDRKSPNGLSNPILSAVASNARELVFHWLSKKNKTYTKYSNLEALQLDWNKNEDW